MENKSFLNGAQAFEKFTEKAEQALIDRYPNIVDGGSINSISIGRNTDSGVGARGGYRVRGNAATMRDALMVDIPAKTLGQEMLANPEAKMQTFIARAEDSVAETAAAAVTQLMQTGMDRQEAHKRVNDSIKSYGYFDIKTKQLVAERVLDRVNDSVLSGLETPFWDIAQIRKVFKQPFLRGYADGLVSSVGVPNMWADLVQIFTETFEGYARLTNVARTTGQMNTSVGVKNRTGTMLSEIVNLVIDYEAPAPNEQVIGGMEGNWLTNAVIGDRDVYANLMLEQLANMLYYFGDTSANFEGLEQIATRDGNVSQYPADQAAADLWANDGNILPPPSGTVNETVGADILLKLSHVIADAMEEMYFLPTRVAVRVSPITYKVLKFSMMSKIYNQRSPMSIMGDVFESGGKLVGTMASKAGEGLWSSFEIVPDPMLMPNTPFNNNSFDITYITFPEIQSAMEDTNITDLIMAPTPIRRMILPSAPGYRDGVVRTSLKRIGSLLVPVAGVVHKIEGLGYNEF